MGTPSRLLSSRAGQAALALTVVLPLAAPARAETVALEPGAWPLSAVGRVNVVLGAGRLSLCTGTLIGPKHVLTAAHCLYDRGRRRWAHPSSVHFVAGYARGTGTAHATAASYAKGAGSAFDETPRAPTLPYDWAVIELASTLPIRPVEIERAPERLAAATMGSARIARAGYRIDRPHVLAVECDCTARPRASDANILSHSCGAVRGESGSALIHLGDDGPRIVGILVAGAKTPGSPSLAVSTNAIDAAAFPRAARP